jgi:hypothetical protein
MLLITLFDLDLLCLLSTTNKCCFQRMFWSKTIKINSRKTLKWSEIRRKIYERLKDWFSRGVESRQGIWQQGFVALNCCRVPSKDNRQCFKRIKGCYGLMSKSKISKDKMSKKILKVANSFDPS